MRKDTLRKMLYVLLCALLLCSFFSLENMEQTSESAPSVEKAVVLSVPHGISMELKGEDLPLDEILTYKSSVQKTISFLRYLFLISWMAVASYILLAFSDFRILYYSCDPHFLTNELPRGRALCARSRLRLRFALA